jgi:hypothetical protein
VKVAALLAVLACVTATKAWIWIVAIAGIAAVDLLRRRSPLRVPTVAWAVPAIAVLVFLQLGFAPASHSVARGSLEVASATARGSIPAGAVERVAELGKNFGLAALPLFVFGAPGLWMVIHASRVREMATLRFLHIPALVYLLAVVGLVGAGAFTGSHRYLYPVLPALALLAAAALDRQSGLIRFGAVAATGLLAIAFLPVFAGFASDNRGLIAAGKAASSSAGLLITDSPVVAYYSGKAPSLVTGSQQLPFDRDLAVEWMRNHEVTAIVMENISYYRAASVFPELAMGKPAPPFQSLGDQRSYQLPRGKPVYAYRLGASSQSIYPGVSAVISPMPAQGKTAVLAKGLALRAGGIDITGEGMGFGSPMVHYPDGWVYSRTAGTIDLSTESTTVWKRTFNLDEIGVDEAHGYQPITSRGRIEVTYTFDRTGVLVELHVLELAPGYMEMGILNEQSAAFDDFAYAGHKFVGSAFGRWMPVEGAWARLRSAAFSVEWSVPAIPGARLHGGRELYPPSFDWAGLDYLFESSPSAVTYHITVQAAR